MTVNGGNLLVPAPPPSGAVTISTHGATIELPSLVADAGELAATASFEFFTARIANANTREAYGRAVGRFCAWLAAGSVPLLGLSSVHVANYLDALGEGGMSVPSVKLHLAGVRHWLDWLTRRGVLPFN